MLNREMKLNEKLNSVTSSHFVKGSFEFFNKSEPENRKEFSSLGLSSRSGFTRAPCLEWVQSPDHHLQVNSNSYHRRPASRKLIDCACEGTFLVFICEPSSKHDMIIVYYWKKCTLTRCFEDDVGVRLPHYFVGSSKYMETPITSRFQASMWTSKSHLLGIIKASASSVASLPRAVSHHLVMPSSPLNPCCVIL